jgi:hypothetical protein
MIRHIGADRVRNALRQQPRGWTKRTAHQAGVSTGAISQVRRGYRQPSESVAAAVGYRKVILWIREEELALADRIEAELLQGAPFKERE